MDSVNKPEISEDSFGIDSLCVEKSVEEIEIDKAAESTKDVELTKNDTDVKHIENDEIGVLLHTVRKRRTSSNTSIVCQKQISDPKKIPDGYPSGSKITRLSLASHGKVQCSDVGWKIAADKSFADKSDATKIVTSSKHAKSISNLPEEVLEEIVKHFSCTTRKNAKLVCKYWFAICSRIFDSREKMFVTARNNVHLDKVLTVLSKSSREHLHLEFYGSNFLDKPLLWKASCGPRILSLKFTYCHLSAVTFANILKGCTNLQTLELHFQEKMEIIDPFMTDLWHLSLKMLKVSFSIDYYFLNNQLYKVHYLINQLFKFFPNMTDFSLHHCGFIESKWFTTPSPGYLHLACNHNCQMNESVTLNFVRRQMENVAMNCFLVPNLQWHTFMAKAEAMTKFTEIAIDIADIVNMDLLKIFVQNQIHLRSITCIAIKQPRETLPTKLIGILWKVPSLREFQLVYKNVIHWNASYSDLLSASNIRSLKIFCPFIRNASQMENLPIFHEKLTSLAIQAIKAYNSSIIQMLNLFPNLEELYLSHMDNSILESICSNQVEVQSLHVQKVLGSLNSVNQMQQLKQLRRLEIPQTKVLVEVERFTCLNHLHICRSHAYETCPHNDTSFSLKHLCTYFCPSLETIRLDSHIELEYPSQFVGTVTEFVSGLKYLKFLSFSCIARSMLTLQDASSIFEQCPSLEVLIVRNSAFFKDVIGGCIRRFDKKTNWDPNPKFNEYELVTKYMNSQIDRHQWDFFFHKVSANMCSQQYL